MRRTWTVLGALVVVLLTAGPASAGPPRELPGQLTDDTIVIGAADRQVVQQAMDRLAAERGIGLHAVFVSDFDAVPAGAWAAQTAALSGLGDSDVLLAVAVAGGTYEYGWWTGAGSPLPVAGVEDVLTSEVEPDLAARRWTDAVLTLAGRLQSLAETAPGPETTAGPSTTAASETTDGSSTATGADTATGPRATEEVLPWSGATTVVVIGVFAVVLLSGHLLSRRRTVSSSTR